MVVHAGDVFDRSRVLPSLAWQALEPLVRIAESGVPVLIVPGNHERSRIPHQRFAHHPLVHVFDRPRTVHVQSSGLRFAFVGFPYERKGVRARFRDLLREAGSGRKDADISFLCIHHCVEGATVGPGNFTFTTASDVIRGRDLPHECAAVLSGHIHRHQVLTHDLKATRLPAPVLYPGSIERTASAEIGERKGYMLLDVSLDNSRPRVNWTFRELPSRPMVVHDLRVTGSDTGRLNRELRSLFSGLADNAVVLLRVIGSPSVAATNVLAARNIRSIAPPDMIVQLRFDRPTYRRPTDPKPPGLRSLFDETGMGAGL